ncbi:MAG: VTT domain-containing protein [Actinomycetota bacterium]|nr:VTT domain-containing protein [Actinomycetota bacterium]
MNLVISAGVTVQSLGPDWLSPESMMNSLGGVAFWVALAIIFAECGILLGFFLPGDSLLFVVGLFIASGAIDMNIWVASFLLVVAALVGNITGYWIGRAIGPSLFNKPDSRFFRKEYVDKTHEFFEKHGGKAIILARFVPIVRTFITAVAGIAKMDFRKYLIYSSIGAVLWAGLITIAGYYLGNIEFIKKNLELVLILVVLVSVIPIIFEYVRHRRQIKELSDEAQIGE